MAEIIEIGSNSNKNLITKKYLPIEFGNFILTLGKFAMQLKICPIIM
jgi:hypothetical protein